jgi:methionyl-tRNA synthetase
MAKCLYLTTTLPYVNADPHIGFALEIVQADIIARYRKLIGDEVFFSTGTDEHGLKIFQKAKEAGKDTQDYVDEYAEKFRSLKGSLGLSDDLHFIRTTDAHHKAAAAEIWKRCLAKGDIEKRKYKGLYCIGDEMFLKEGDLVDGKCPNHPTMTPVEIEEENYFFKLSAYSDRLKKYLSREGVILPEWRRLEALTFVEGGLEDFSISRVKEKMPWGVPVPGDEGQVMYVWFDALTNYISTLGWPEDSEGNFKRYWEEGETVQMAGKDQIRFQSIMWQAMLMSAGIKNTDRVVYHGFINSGGQKMSKSLGNVIKPTTIIEVFNEAGANGTEVLRYFLARHCSPFDDSDVTIDRIKEAYNADLTNGLGNLTSRIMQLAQTYLPVDRPERTKPAYPIEFHQALIEFDYAKALQYVFGQIAALDSKISATEPFKLIKTNPAEGTELMLDLILDLYVIGHMLDPFMPETSKRIKTAVETHQKPENLFPRVSEVDISQWYEKYSK